MGLIPRLDYFCCQCSLKSGALIVLIVPLICIILSPFADTTVVGSGSLFMTIVVYIMYAVVCIAGLYGVYKEKRAFLIPFLVFDVWIIIGSVLYCFRSFFANIGVTLIILLFLPVYGYAFLVMLSYFLEMGAKKATASTTGA